MAQHLKNEVVWKEVKTNRDVVVIFLLFFSVKNYSLVIQSIFLNAMDALKCFLDFLSAFMIFLSAMDKKK